MSYSSDKCILKWKLWKCVRRTFSSHFLPLNICWRLLFFFYLSASESQIQHIQQFNSMLLLFINLCFFYEKYWNLWFFFLPKIKDVEHDEEIKDSFFFIFLLIILLQFLKVNCYSSCFTPFSWVSSLTSVV